MALPRIGSRADISFLIDTGADRTIIMPTDGLLLGIDYAQLSGNVPTVGLGGACNLFEENSLLAFSEQGKRLYIYALDILIAAPSDDNLIAASRNSASS